MVASIIGQGVCISCGAPINLRRGLVTKYCHIYCGQRYRRKHESIEIKQRRNKMQRIAYARRLRRKRMAGGVVGNRTSVELDASHP